MAEMHVMQMEKSAKLVRKTGFLKKASKKGRRGTFTLKYSRWAKKDQSEA